MIRKFSFDYDYENDDLFLFDPKSKSKASVEMADIIIDFNSKSELSGIEIMNASNFFYEINTQEITREMLNEIKTSKIDIITKNNFLIVKFILTFKSKEIITPIFIPTLKEQSPSLKV